MMRVFVSGLPDDVRERDLSDRFAKFGRVASITIKFPPRPPPFAFIEYEEESNANDAVDKMNGRDFQGRRLRVEISRGGSGGSADAARRQSTQYKVQLSNLPPRMTSMELKDFLRGGGDVVHADVDRRGGGSASFATFDEMKSAIRTLDKRELEGEPIRIREDRWPAARSDRDSATPLAYSRPQNVLVVSISISLSISFSLPLALPLAHSAPPCAPSIALEIALK